MPTLPADDPLAAQLVRSIRAGNVEALAALLLEHPELAKVQITTPGCDDTRSLLHIVADWPGHVPNGAAMVAVLVAAGADVDARGAGRVTETPLQWAASSDDVAVLDALLDAGANMEASGAVIGGGTALDAVAFGQWRAAERLVERGAKVALDQAAALDKVEHLVSGAGAYELSHALWHACRGGRRRAAEYLLDNGACINWIAPWDHTTPFDAALRSGDTAFADWLREQGARSGAQLD